jgi:TolA-binding protein
MAKHLGRLLEPWEVVHHKNRNKQDNRIENLELVSKETHALITRMEQEIDRLRREVERLLCLTQREK